MYNIDRVSPINFYAAPHGGCTTAVMPPDGTAQKLIGGTCNSAETDTSEVS